MNHDICREVTATCRNCQVTNPDFRHSGEGRNPDPFSSPQRPRGRKEESFAHSRREPSSRHSCGMKPVPVNTGSGNPDVSIIHFVGRATVPAIFAVIPAEAGIRFSFSSPQRRRGFREQLKRRPSQKTAERWSQWPCTGRRGTRKQRRKANFPPLLS